MEIPAPDPPAPGEDAAKLPDDLPEPMFLLPSGAIQIKRAGNLGQQPRMFQWTIAFADNTAQQGVIQAPNFIAPVAAVLAQMASEPRKIVGVSIVEIKTSPIVAANGKMPPFHPRK